MASNMWKNVEKVCEVCDQEIGSEVADMVEEDGSPHLLVGATIEDDDGKYLTVCERCLRAITNQDWALLSDIQEAHQ